MIYWLVELFNFKLTNYLLFMHACVFTEVGAYHVLAEVGGRLSALVSSFLLLWDPGTELGSSGLQPRSGHPFRASVLVSILHFMGPMCGKRLPLIYFPFLPS